MNLNMNDLKLKSLTLGYVRYCKNSAFETWTCTDVSQSEQMRSQVRALEDRVSRLATEKTELESQSEEAEEDVNSLERKLRNVISEVSHHLHNH